MLQLISGVKDIFMNPKYFQVTDSYFPESGRLFLSNYIQYEKNATYTINEESNKNNSDTKEHYTNDLIQHFRDILSDTSISQNAKMGSLKTYYLESYIVSLNHK